MSNESTEIYKPKFFLHGNNKVIKIESNKIIGRGDVDSKIQDRRLSSAHCRITIKGLKVFVTDLNSSNGTFINGDKLDPQVETELKLGSKLDIGSYSYFLKDTQITNKETSETSETNVSVSELSLTQKLNFFGVHISWKIAYVAVSLFFMSFYFLSTPPNKYPPSLEFLVQGYYSTAHLNMIFIAISLYAGCMLHAYLIKEYFQRSYFLSGLTYIFLLVCKLATVMFFFSFSDFHYVRSYLEAREEIVKNPHTELAHQYFIKDFSPAFKRNLKLLPKEYKSALINDFEQIRKDYVKDIVSSSPWMIEQWDQGLGCTFPQEVKLEDGKIYKGWRTTLIITDKGALESQVAYPESCPPRSGESGVLFSGNKKVKEFQNAHLDLKAESNIVGAPKGWSVYYYKVSNFDRYIFRIAFLADQSNFDEMHVMSRWFQAEDIIKLGDPNEFSTWIKVYKEMGVNLIDPTNWPEGFHQIWYKRVAKDK